MITCSTCGKEYPETDHIKTRGKICKPCRAGYARIYQDEKRREKGMKKYNTPKPEKTLTPKQIKYRKTMEENKAKRKAQYKYLGKKARDNFKNIRKQGNRLPDRETYCSNQTWEADHTMFINLDELRDIPMERLTVEYWKDIEHQNEQRMIKNTLIYGDHLVCITDCSYLKKDKNYGGRYKSGGIVLYPT